MVCAGMQTADYSYYVVKTETRTGFSFAVVGGILVGEIVLKGK